MTTSTPKEEKDINQEPFRKRARATTNKLISQNCNMRQEVCEVSLICDMSNVAKSGANNTSASSTKNTTDSRVNSVSTSDAPSVDVSSTRTNDSPASRILIRRDNLRRVRKNIVQKRSRRKVSQIVLMLPLSIACQNLKEISIFYSTHNWCVQLMVDSRVNSVSTSDVPSVDASSTKPNNSTSNIFF